MHSHVVLHSSNRHRSFCPLDGERIDQHVWWPACRAKWRRSYRGEIDRCRHKRTWLRRCAARTSAFWPSNVFCFVSRAERMLLSDAISLLSSSSCSNLSRESGFKRRSNLRRQPTYNTRLVHATVGGQHCQPASQPASQPAVRVR